MQSNVLGARHSAGHVQCKGHAVDRRADGDSGGDVEGDDQPLPIAPAGQHSVRIVHHRRRVRLDPVGMKGRRDETALAPPELAVAGQQAVAQVACDAGPGIAILGVLDELAGLRHQHLADVVGVGDEVLLHLADLQAVEVVVFRQPTGWRCLPVTGQDSTASGSTTNGGYALNGLMVMLIT